MALLSPGVESIEKNFSGIVQSSSSATGAMVIRASAGPIEVPVLISGEDQLFNIFGAPNDTNANDWWTVAEYLKYSKVFIENIIRSLDIENYWNKKEWKWVNIF